MGIPDNMKRLRLVGATALLGFVLSASLVFAQGASVERNVVFGTYAGLALLLDVHKPAMPNGYGIVEINGSGWHRELGYDAELLKDGNDFRPAIEKLLASGYTVFVIDHRAAPGFHMQDAIDDAQRAVRFVRANARRYGIRTDRIGALGGSSGAHLVSLLGTLDGKGDAGAMDPVEHESAKVQCVVAFFPAIDLTTLDTPIGAGALAAIMGMRPPTPGLSPSSQRMKMYRDASPINHVSADAAPFLLLHGDADQTVPYHQSELMDAALRKAGVPVKLVPVPGGGHGARGPAWDKVNWAALTLDWFNGHLRATATSSAAR